PDLAASVAREHRDVVLGIKVREQVEVVGAHGLEPLRRGLRAAEVAGVPVIVHVNNPPAEYGEVLALLRPGDIVSHFFHGRGSGILDAGGRHRPERGPGEPGSGRGGGRRRVHRGRGAIPVPGRGRPHARGQPAVDASAHRARGTRVVAGRVTGGGPGRVAAGLARAAGG